MVMTRMMSLMMMMVMMMTMIMMVTEPWEFLMFLDMITKKRIPVVFDMMITKSLRGTYRHGEWNGRKA